MSGLRPFEMTQFYRRLAERGLCTADLAAQVGVTRQALCRVLNGARRRGAIWKRVAALLTPEERHLLDVALCHPWNSRRVARRPKWERVAGQVRGEGVAA